MKFILFNLIVAASMYYLLAGDAGRDTMEEAADKAFEAASPIVERAKDALVSVSGAPEVATAPSPQPQPLAPILDTVVVEERMETPPELATPPSPSVPLAREPAVALAVSSDETLLQVDPEIERRRAEVLGFSDSVEPGAVMVAQFMTPAQRRAELDRLVREMEILFARKMGN